MSDLPAEAHLLRAGCAWSDRLTSGATAVPSQARASEEEWSAWRRAVDPDDAGLFARRLAWEGLTEASARRLLDGSPQSVAADWLPELRSLRDALVLSRGKQPDPVLRDVPFDRLVSPMVHDVWGRLEASCDPAWLAGWSPVAYLSLQHDLGTQIAQVAADAWYADFTQSRTEGAELMARLGLPSGGDTRFRRWCDAQAADGMAQILAQYPALGRLLSVTTSSWSRATRAMLSRIHAHRDDLASVLDVAAAAPVTGIRPGLSDRHRGGHSVAIIEFGDNRIVYKPKDLRIEQQFHRLARAVNGWFGDRSLHEIDVITGDGPYGFTSHVTHTACPVESLPHFYRAAGRLTALLYLLGATDAHFENVIAAGSGIALIDAETLFHADITGTLAQEDVPLADTVLRTGMLPGWSLAGRDQVAFDPSALGVPTALEAHFDHGWAHPNTDDMVWTRVRTQARARHSVPVDPPAANPLKDHVEDLVQGFRDIYTACDNQQFRQLLLDALPGFRGLAQRVVLRGTRIYALVQQKAYSAPALLSANARAMQLERLSRLALISGARDPWWAVYQAELHDMENLDIPYFGYRLGSEAVDGSLGPIPGLIPSDPLEEAAKRIDTRSDLQWQERLIRGAVRARYVTADRASPPGSVPTAGPVAVDDRLVAGILSDIHRAAMHREDGSVTWLVLSRLPGGNNVRLGIIGDGWYDGRCGLGAVQQWAADSGAVATLAPVVDVLEQQDPYVRFRYLRNLGLGFSGVGGLLRWSLLPTAGEGAPGPQQLVDAVPAELVARDRYYDLIGGVAGLLGPLARIVRSTPTQAAIDLLTAAAEHLRAAQRDDGGWPSQMGRRPLTGFAHGAAGCGLALLEAGTTLGQEHWIDAGAAAFRYEASVFDAEAGNWPDFRDKPGPPMVAWCHGAAGIGLSRYRALHLLPDHADAGRWISDLQAAMHTTASAPVSGTDHLCCGLTGRAAVLRIVGLAMGEDRWISASHDLTAVAVLRSRDRGRFTLPLDDVTDPQTVSPGLMTGLAGIAAHLIAQSQDQDLTDFLL